MSIINKSERLEQTAKFVINKLKAKVKTNGVRLAEIFISPGEITIETDSPQWVEDEISSLINKTQHGIFVSSKIYPGFFDWAADTYIKDSVIIKFRI
jgi:hypothetical protein